jgi:hypothetical protein
MVALRWRRKPLRCVQPTPFSPGLWPAYSPFPLRLKSTEVEGSAIGSVEYECTPCCFLRNLGTKRVAVSVITREKRVSDEVARGETKTLSDGGECVRAGYLLRVDPIR